MNKNERIEPGDYVRIFRYYEASHRLFAELRDTGAIGRVVQNTTGIDGLQVCFADRNNVLGLYEINGSFREKDLELADIAALDSTPEADSDEQSWREFQAREAAAREQELQVWREENKDWIEFQAKEGQPEPDPKDALIAELRADNDALKLDRQRILERNLALTEALEDIHGLVNPPETIVDSSYPILLRILDTVENVLRDEPAADRKAE